MQLVEGHVGAAFLPIAGQQADAHGRIAVQGLVRPFDVQDGVVADLDLGQEPGPAELACSDAQGGTHVHDLVIVDMDAYAEFVRLSFLAVKDEGIGLLGAADPVGDRFESAGTVQVGQERFDLLAAVQASLGHEAGTEQEFPLFRRDALDADGADLDLFLPEVDGARMVQSPRLGADFPGHFLEIILIFLRQFIAQPDDVGDALLVEGKHGVAGQLVLEQDVGPEPVDAGGVGRHHRDVLHQQAGGRTQLGDLAVDGHLGADDDVGPHRLGDIDREVVPRAAVGQDHVLGADRPEVERDGHRGPHGIHQQAGRPVLLAHGVHVRRHAEEGNGQVLEG